MTHTAHSVPIPWNPHVARQRRAAAPALDVHRARVLVVDDNPFCRRLMRITLNGFNIREVAEADGVKDALAAMRTFIPDLILVDWEMGEVDGLAFVREVRHHDDLGVRCTPIILVSGYSERWRIERARDAGANEYIVKPYAVKTLYAKIRDIVQGQRPFVDVTSGYFGPDRRWRDKPIDDDRRSDAVGHRSLVSVDLDSIFASAGNELTTNRTSATHGASRPRCAPLRTRGG